MCDITKGIMLVDAFVTTLIDKSDGDKSVEKAIAILHTAGYNASSIALHVDEAHSKVIKWLAKIIT